MAFNRRENRHDRWLRFCGQFQQHLCMADLPDVIVLSEDRFRDLLRNGVASSQEIRVSLAELSTEQWIGLSQFTEVFFREYESYAPLELFPAYRREAEQRC